MNVRVCYTDNNITCVHVHVSFFSCYFTLSLSLRVIEAVRTLLSLIPINQKVLEALEVFVHPISSEGASEDTRLPPTPAAVLSEFYDASTVSPTQLLYNLEVWACI